MGVYEIPTRKSNCTKRVVCIDRGRVSQTDGPVDVMLDGVVYSSAEATNVLICDNVDGITRFPYYIWSHDGMFRYDAGTFRWYFLLKQNECLWQVPEVLETCFEEDINFEYDSTENIRRMMRSRLENIIQALEVYVPKQISEDGLMRKIFKPKVQFRL